MVRVETFARTLLRLLAGQTVLCGVPHRSAMHLTPLTQMDALDELGYTYFFAYNHHQLAERYRGTSLRSSFQDTVTVPICMPQHSPNSSR